MKTLFVLTVGLIVIPSTCLAAQADSGKQPSPAKGPQVRMIVVAEQANPNAAPARTTPDHPAYYIAFDGGYIEAGDPIAGERPPTPAAIAQTLHRVLGAQGYLPATSNSAPTLLLIYHWGRLSRDSFAISPPFEVNPNLRARVALVAPQRYAREIYRDIESRLMMRELRMPFYVPAHAFISFRARDLLDLARDDHYFVVLSAYDFDAIRRHEAKLLWRVKMSTRSPGNAMDEALPALIRGGGQYFGLDFDDSQLIKTPLVPEGRVEIGTPEVQEFLPPPEITKQMDDHYVRTLVMQQHKELSGERPREVPDKGPPPPTNSASGSAYPFLPAALAGQISTYQQQKSTLQNALAARLTQHTPGEDTRRAIDIFNEENAGRIAALAKEREAIRDELARLAAANTDAATGKSLNALLQEFAAGVRQLTTEPGTASN